jgi:hypothetical protein
MKKILLSITALSTAFLVSAQAPMVVPNGTMEAWSSAIGEPQGPTSWVTANVFAAPAISASNPTSCTQYTPPFSGTFAAQIKTVVLTTNPAYPGIPDTAGVMMLGKVVFTTPYLLAGVPYTDRPNALSFASIYTPVGADSAFVAVSLTKWDAVNAVRKVIAQNYNDIGPSTGYNFQSISLTYVDMVTIPDTLQLAFYSSFASSGSKAIRAKARPGSTLVVDGVTLSGFMGIQEYKNVVSVSSYPNPASTVLNLVTDSRKVDFLNVYDITGQLVDKLAISNDHTLLNTAVYSPGIYIYCAVNRGGETLARGKFNVAR